MFDLGDELIIGNYRAPWLIWIQLLVTLLLILLLYYFNDFALGLTDLSPDPSKPSTSTAVLVFPADSSTYQPSHAAAASSSRSNNTKVGQSQRIKADAGTSTSIRKLRREDTQAKESIPSADDAAHSSVLERSYHPCHYIGLARQAFLKCLGLAPDSEDSPHSRRRKEQ
ncbi:hypothetical protein NMG60_11007224 [Bertholletia excelsa]